MIWFVENYNNIQYMILKYIGIDISYFTDYQKLTIIIGVNIMVLLILFICLYVFKHIMYKILTCIS